MDPANELKNNIQLEKTVITTADHLLNHIQSYEITVKDIETILECLQKEKEHILFRLIRELKKHKNENQSVYTIIQRLITIQLEQKGLDEKVLDDFTQLYESMNVPEKTIDSFFKRHKSYFKLKTRRKLGRAIKEVLKENTQRNEQEIGPRITESECEHLKNHFIEFLETDKIMKTVSIQDIELYLFGSLVSGFSSSQSLTPNTATDKGRISDVDLTIIVPVALIRLLIEKNQHQKFAIIRDAQSYFFGPIDSQKSHLLEQFAGIFTYIQKLSFAKRKGRKIGITICSPQFFHSVLKAEPHIKIY